MRRVVDYVTCAALLEMVVVEEQANAWRVFKSWKAVVVGVGWAGVHCSF